MRNVEIKAKVSNLKQLLEQAKTLAGTEATIIKQHDTFYKAPNGRLKLRRLLNTGNGELIFYDRPDTEGPKLSNYEKVAIDSRNLSGLNEVLVKALGVKNDVKKIRYLFTIGQTRVHVDEVDNLGSFMELEVCLRPEQTPGDGEQVAHGLMTKLGIEEKDLISGAYVDLLSDS